MSLHRFQITCVALCCLALAKSGTASTRDIEIGGLVLSVSDSWTAQVFHIVDQLSEWDQYTHKQYGRWASKYLKIDPEDRKMLQKHAELRRARGWGNGFEQAFYVDSSIPEAARLAVESNLLPTTESDVEKDILLHFSSKLSGLRNSGAVQIAAFTKRLVSERRKLKPVVQKIRRFSQTSAQVRLPVFLVTNPSEGNGGGGANGGRLVVEVQNSPDPLPFLIHEALHSLLDPNKDAIKTAAASAGLEWQVLNEGIAYALAPGLTDNALNEDTLVETVVRNVLRGKPASDSYMKFYMLAAVLRPLLRSALDHGETITVFLPKAVERWRIVAGGS